MKLNNTAIIDAKAIDYLSTKSMYMVKKTLYVMTLLDDDQQLADSSFEEGRAIAAIYDGYIITAKAAKDLAHKLMKMYAAKNPHVFLSKKEFETYTNVWYRKLYEAEGILGFEYVLEVIRIGKAVAKNPASGISEPDMLRALRWVEMREGVNKESSNRHHRMKGLELLGFVGFEEILLDLSMVIANIYELVSPKNENQPVIPEVKEVKNGAEKEVSVMDVSVRAMKRHFIQKAELLEAYYNAKMPEVPAGYEEKELKEDQSLQAFARRGILKDSEAIVAYIDGVKAYDDLQKAVSHEFNSLEQEEILKHKVEIIKLISNEW